MDSRYSGPSSYDEAKGPRDLVRRQRSLHWQDVQSGFQIFRDPNDRSIKFQQKGRYASLMVPPGVLRIKANTEKQTVSTELPDGQTLKYSGEGALLRLKTKLALTGYVGQRFQIIEKTRVLNRGEIADTIMDTPNFVSIESMDDIKPVKSLSEQDTARILAAVDAKPEHKCSVEGCGEPAGRGKLSQLCKQHKAESLAEKQRIRRKKNKEMVDGPRGTDLLDSDRRSDWSHHSRIAAVA